MLASDAANPDFVGAKNPDSGLHVEFYWHEPVDPWKSREESQRLEKRVTVKGEKTIYCRIMVPGVKETIWEEAVREHHKQRFPRQWMAWQISEGIIGSDGDIPGWKIQEWDELNDDQIRELTYLRFQTVEQLAGATDKQLQGIGMGGLALKEKARTALRNRMGAETREALEKERAEKEELKARLRRLEDLIAGKVPVDPSKPPSDDQTNTLMLPEKRGPGRPLNVR